MDRSPDRPRRPVVMVVGVVALVVLVAGACSVARQGGEDIIEKRTQGTFASLPNPLPSDAPGTLIRSERLLGAPNGAEAWRVLYHSTDLNGTDIGVSGIVVVPQGPVPAGGRTVVSWAHPTTGSQPPCGPSVATDPFELIEGSHELLDAGYVIAATDYSGMGANGPNSYLIGLTEAHNVLDAVRAARNLENSRAGSDVLLWGHSQGGQAALFAAQTIGRYAGELHLKGVAVAAPAVELAELMDDHIDDASGVTIGAYAFDAYQKVYGPTMPDLTLDTMLTPAGRAALPTMVPYCLLTQSREIHAIVDPLVGKFLAGDPSTIQPWATLLAQNTPGQSPVGVPMLVTQGLSDQLVKPATTAQFVQTLCSAGEHVQYRTYADVNHGLVAERAVPLLIPWFAAVMAGKTTEDTCAAGGPVATTTTTVP